MAKSTHKPKRHIPVRSPAAAREETRKPVTHWLKRAFGLKSLLVATAGGLLLFWTVTENSGYWWVWEKLLKDNWVLIQKHRAATLGERYQMKLGFDYVFWDFLKQHTPDSAVILFPLKQYNTEKAGNSQLTDKTNNKYWVTHFVYPRRVLYKDEQDTNPRYNDVTHVAIVAGHGSDDLEYRVSNLPDFTVLPKQPTTMQ
jgi:hypothetical protein